MFKGLKSKLEDQSKKLQASVAQYGEQLSEQIGNIRSAASDAGSDASGAISRRFLPTGGTNNGHPSLEDSLNHSIGNALMEEVTEADLLGLDLPRRERRLSGGSTHSNESSFSSFFQSVPGMTATTLDDMDSDRESVLDESASGIVRSADKEQINTVISKLHGRAANYKDKYRDLVKKYNNVVTENNKCRTVLEHNQDQALEKYKKYKAENKELSNKIKELQKEPESAETVRKYQAMVDKCKVKIQQLKTENDQLRTGKEHAEGESGMADFASERIAAEWKQKIDKVEGDWTERLTTVESNLMDQVAAAKKETYNVMESKDKEIEVLRSRCHELEFQDGQANERWQKKVDELQSIVQALETEKTDMVEKLSAAKTQGVQAVRDEEAVKREALLAEWREKESRWAAEADERVEAAEKEHKELLAKRTVELESLRAMQEKGTSQTDELKAAERGLEIQLAEVEEKLAQAQTSSQRQADELQAVVEDLTAKHKAQVADLIREHEELISSNKTQTDVERGNLMETVTQLQGEVEELRRQVEGAQTVLEEQKRTMQDEHHLKQKNLSEELTKCQEELEDLKEKSKKQLEELKTVHGKELSAVEKELERLRQDLEENITESAEEAEKASASKKDSEEQVVELRAMLEERNQSIHRLENEKLELESELAQSRELSGIHEHLREELDEARKQKQETEVKLLVAEKAAQELQEAAAKVTISEAEVKTNGDAVEDLIQLESAPTLEAPLEATKVDREVEEFKERLSEVERKNEELEGRLAALTAEREDLQEKLSTISIREGELSVKHEEELSAMRDTWEALETEKSALSSRLASLQSETSAMIEDLRKRADTADSLLEEEKDSKKKVEEQLAEVQEKLSNHEVLIADSEESKKAVEQLKEMEEKREAVEKQLRESEEKRKEAVEHTESVKAERDVLLEKIRLSEASEEQRTAELTSIKEKLQESDAKIQDLVVEKSKLTVQTEELASQKKDLEGKMTGLQEQADRLLAEKAELSSRADEASKLISLVEQEKSRVDQLEQAYKAKITDLETKLTEELTKNEASAAELTALKASLEGSAAQKSEELAKIRELEGINERMRVEFIAKEKIISELRVQLDKAREEASEAGKAAEGRLQAMEEKLKSALSEVEAAGGTVEKLKAALDEAKAAHEANEKQWTAGKEEEIRIREQYSLALENSKTELTDAHERIKALEGVKEEAARLQKQLQETTEAHEQIVADLTKEKEALAVEWTEKARKAVHKQKKLAEDEASSAKAEFILQVEELRSKVAEKERRLDDVVLEKARLEQELIALATVKEDLEQRKEKEKMVSSKLSESERRVMELEAENSVLGERKSELEKTKSDLTTELEEKNRVLAEQTQQIKALSENNDEAIRKAAVKQDTDSKKVIRELQREVKQLYVELNEKAEAADSLMAQLEEAKNNNQPAVSVKAATVEATPQKDFMYEEELDSMRRKLKESHREIDELKDINSRLERNLDSSRKSQNSAPAAKTNGQASLSLEYSSFADPAEAEYLKNVLYRYMVERESLGKECVTLARVIGTVAKFNKSQLDAVLAREEYRLSGWVGGAVGLSNVLNGARP